MAQLNNLIVNGSARVLGNIYGDLKGNADTATVATSVAKIKNSLTLVNGASTTTTFDGSAATNLTIDKVVTQAEYDALPDTKNSDGITYYISDGGASEGASAGSSTKPVYFSSGKPIECGSELAVNISGTAANATNIYSSSSTATAYILGTTTASSANHATVYNSSIYTSGSVLYGAAWNDYAEYRQADTITPGYVVVEKGDDTLVRSSSRLQGGASIISDTYGFAIGKTDECQTPIAVSGRVLAYPYESRNEFKNHIGDPVCSGPDGTVSIMTPEEERNYPSKIIGIISAVPEYKVWGTGNVNVNGRVWIKVR